MSTETRALAILSALPRRRLPGFDARARCSSGERGFAPTG